MKIVFLLEEGSMKETLFNILPQIMPPHISYQLIKHNGKSDLRRSIPNKLRGWRESNVYFVIVHDQDSNDCIQLKRELSELARESSRPDTLVRIACTELESWFLGDMEAIEKAYSRKLTQKGRAKYRTPDNLKNAKEELRKLIDYQPISGSRSISKHLDISNNKSRSFNVFVSGVKRLCDNYENDAQPAFTADSEPERLNSEREIAK